MGLVSLSKTDPLTLICEWQECQHVYEDMKDFLTHVTEHLKEIAPVVENDNEQLEGEFGCEWRECGQDIMHDFFTLVRHVYFHAFHVKLKSFGTTVILKNGLRGCLLDSSSRNMIPDLPDRLHCSWKNCNVSYDNPDIFYNHVRDHCNIYPDTKNVPGGCPCLWQGCTTNNKKDKYKLKDHLKTHTQEKSIACPTCGSLFSTSTKFFDHIKRQQESDGTAQTYQCSHCDKRFATERLLRDHMRHHVNHCKCPYCDMTLPNQSTLRNHITYRHKEDRPFQCACGEYTGKTMKDLKAHEETHTDTNFLHCGVEGCFFRTRAMNQLNKHYSQKHAGDEDNTSRYACHVCDRKYFRGSKLTQHLRKSHNFQWPPGHKRFKYKLCDDRFYRLQTTRYESVELMELKAQAARQAEKKKKEAVKKQMDFSYNLDLLGDVAVQAKTRENQDDTEDGHKADDKEEEEMKLPPKKRRRKGKPSQKTSSPAKSNKMNKYGRCEIVTDTGHKIIVESNVPFAGVADHMPKGAQAVSSKPTAPHTTVSSYHGQVECVELDMGQGTSKPAYDSYDEDTEDSEMEEDDLSQPQPVPLATASSEPVDISQHEISRISENNQIISQKFLENSQLLHTMNHRQQQHPIVIMGSNQFPQGSLVLPENNPSALEDSESSSKFQKILPKLPVVPTSGFPQGQIIIPFVQDTSIETQAAGEDMSSSVSRFYNVRGSDYEPGSEVDNEERSNYVDLKGIDVDAEFRKQVESLGIDIAE